MKHPFRICNVIILAIFALHCTHAQDTITLINGSEEEVKIVNVTDEFIEFYILSDPKKKVVKAPLSNILDYHWQGQSFNLAPGTEVVSDERFIYSLIVGRKKFLSKKVIVTIDYGQEVKFMKQSERIINPETGNPFQFNSMIDALNYMSVEKGWEFVNAYIITVGDQNVYHYLVKKRIKLDPKED